MKTNTEQEEILAGLEPMFREARATGKWFWTAYQDIWFSPSELEAEHAKGKFLWGAPNWKLRDPKEKLAAIDKKIAEAQAEWATVAARMNKGAWSSS